MGFRLSLSPFPGLFSELVVHSTEWATGSQLLTQFAPFPRLLAELVVHSTEWATGSQLLTQFALFSRLSLRASGPLDGVGHWLLAFGPVYSQVQNPV